jgi:hypothetical protein
VEPRVKKVALDASEMHRRLSNLRAPRSGRRSNLKDDPLTTCECAGLRRREPHCNSGSNTKLALLPAGSSGDLGIGQFSYQRHLSSSTPMLTPRP